MKTPPIHLNGSNGHHKAFVPSAVTRRNPPRRWQDAACLLLGLWLFVTPWVWPGAVLNPLVPSESAWAAWIPGALIAVLALCALIRPRFLWPDWGMVAPSFWLLIQPSVPGFALIASVPTWDEWTVGLVVCVLAIWAA